MATWQDLSRRRNKFTFSFSFPSEPGWYRHVRSSTFTTGWTRSPTADRIIARCTNVEIIPRAVADALPGICFDVASSNEVGSGPRVLGRHSSAENFWQFLTDFWPTLVPDIADSAWRVGEIARNRAISRNRYLEYSIYFRSFKSESRFGYILNFIISTLHKENWGKKRWERLLNFRSSYQRVRFVINA